MREYEKFIPVALKLWLKNSATPCQGNVTYYTNVEMWKCGSVIMWKFSHSHIIKSSHY